MNGDKNPTSVLTVEDVRQVVERLRAAREQGEALGLLVPSPGLHNMPRAVFEAIPTEQQRHTGSGREWWQKEWLGVNIYCDEPPPPDLTTARASTNGCDGVLHLVRDAASDCHRAEVFYRHGVRGVHCARCGQPCIAEHPEALRAVRA